MNKIILLVIKINFILYTTQICLATKGKNKSKNGKKGKDFVLLTNLQLYQ